MAHYTARVTWARFADENFVDHRYSRGHNWSFDGGVTIPASSSPHVVPTPYSVEAHVDPEEAFVASLSSCHMLFFLSIVAKHGFVVDKYVDDAVGLMGRNGEGRMAMLRVTLRPVVTFSGDRQPTLEELERMHHASHEQCFLANSVTTNVVTDIAPDQDNEGST
ncbi:MAG: OsmC family protein [Acidobacteriota bacterium]